MRKLTSLQSWVLVVLLWSSIASSSNGQVTLYSPHIVADHDQTVGVDIKVADFDNMVAAQFTIEYDSLVLDFNSVGNFGIFNISNQNIGIPLGPFPTPKGIITFAWIADNLITGQSMADSSVLFTATFKVIGSSGQTSPIHFSDSWTDLEFGDTSDVAIPHTLYDGSVTVSGGTAVEEIVTEDFIFYPVSPNPVADVAEIRFQLQRASQTTLSIYDISGNRIYQEAKFYSSGLHALTLPRDVFPVTGAYFAHLSTGNAQAVQKLIVAQ
ncbi:MAG: T9SS type A sorting domain-containing protein [Lewinellaceae bacterium]|nr:T9SS type A sorting domain-containing protein [Lewinellaceae bacterium]